MKTSLLSRLHGGILALLYLLRASLSHIPGLALTQTRTVATCPSSSCIIKLQLLSAAAVRTLGGNHPCIRTESRLNESAPSTTRQAGIIKPVSISSSGPKNYFPTATISIPEGSLPGQLALSNSDSLSCQ